MIVISWSKQQPQIIIKAQSDTRDCYLISVLVVLGSAIGMLA